MFERYTERARRVLFFARYEASQLGSISIETEHLLLGLIREGKGLTSRIFARSHLSLETIRKEIEGRTVFPREGVDLGRDSVQHRDQACAPARRRGSRPPSAQLHRDRASAAGYPARGPLRCGVDTFGKGHALEHGPGGHRPVAQRKDDADPGQGDTAAGGVQPGPYRGRHEKPARPAGGTRQRAGASAAGAVPTDEEQRRADWRAGGGEDGHRGGARPEDFLR